MSRLGLVLQTGVEQRGQKWRRLPAGVAKLAGLIADGSQEKPVARMKPTVVNAAPWTRRQNPQWQFMTGAKSPDAW